MSTPIADAQQHRAFDVGAERIARVYAESLYNASPQGEAEALGVELAEMVSQAFVNEPALAAFFSSGIISSKQKHEFIENHISGRASATFVNFLHVLNNHSRLDLLEPIYYCYVQLLNEKKRRVRVLVKSAVALDDQYRERLKSDIKTKFNLDPVLDEEVDPDLLGGLLVRVGDWQFDGTVAARLNHLKNQLLERSSHEIQGGRDRFCTVE